MKKGRNAAVGAAILLVGLLAGCNQQAVPPGGGSTQSSQASGTVIEKPGTSQTTGVSQTTGEATQSPNEDKTFSERLRKEKEVLGGSVYFQGDSVIGTIVIKNTYTEAQGKKLAQKYADDLKKAYKDKKIMVQATKSNKNIATITYEPEAK